MAGAPNRRTVMQRGLARLCSVAVLALSLLVAPTAARADSRVAELTKMLSSSSEKTRMSAVVSLARLQDRSTLKPLVSALMDPNAQVRALAAAALGRLG